MTKNKSNGQPESKAKKIIFFLAWVITPAAGLLSPWFLPLLKADLFPAYFQPLSQAFGSTVFLIAFLAALGLHRKTSQEKMRSYLWRWLFAFVVSPVICFMATHVFSDHWGLDASWEPVVHAVWLLVYAMVFASMAFAVVLAAYLICGNDA